MKALGVEQSLLAPGTGSLSATLASLAARYGMAMLAVLAGARISPLRINREEWKHGAILAVFTGAGMALQVDGLNYTLASTGGFLIALYCVLVPLIAWMAGERRMTLILFACCLLVLAGLAVLTGYDPRKLGLGRGEWESLGAACMFAVQIYRVDRIPAGGADPMRVTAVLLGLVAIGSFAGLALTPGGPGALAAIHASPRAFLLTLALALFGTAAPFALMNRFQARVGSVAAGFIYCCEPLTTALGAFWLPQLLVRDPADYPNESATPKLLLGGALILAANLLLTRDKGGKPPPGT